MNILEKAAIHFRKEKHPYNSKKGNPTIGFLFFNKLHFAVINTALQTFFVSKQTLRPLLRSNFF